MGFGFSPQVYKIIAQRLADKSAEPCLVPPTRGSLREERRQRRQAR
jgi:hypothetical protein